MKLVKVTGKVTESLRTRRARLVFYIVLLAVLFAIALSVKSPTASGTGYVPPVSAQFI
jgi:hypothetical protein